MKIFYAHPKSMYGSSVENEDVGTMGMMGFNVLNPNCSEIQTRIRIMRECGNTEEEILAFELSQIDKCGGVIFRRSFLNEIPPDVLAAIGRAKADRKPVLELPRLEDSSISE